MPDKSQAPEGFVPEGTLKPNLDAPIDEYVPFPSADVLTDEADPPVPITDRGFGPTEIGEEMTDEDMEAVGAEDESTDEPQDKPSDDEPRPKDASSEGDDVKKGPQSVPYDRFQEVIAENQRLKQAEQVLNWIMSNPEQAAARLGAKGQQPAGQVTQQEPKYSLHIEEPAKPSKPFEEMSDEEKAQLWVERAVFSALKKAGLEKFAEGVSNDVGDLFSFKGQLQETLTRNAVDADGKPLYPRWDELKGTMSEVKARYPNMTDAEAYVLADRYIPQSTPMQDDMAQYNQQRTPPVVASEPPQMRPKKASSAAMRAAKVASFGRSSPGLSPVNPEYMSTEEAASRAFDNLFKEGGL